MATSPLSLSTDPVAELGARLNVRFALPRPSLTERIATGIPAIDALCSGGIPRGTLTEVYGPASSGRTSFLLATIAAVTARQEYAAVVDTADSFDPASAINAGVHLSRVLWIRCGGNAEHALKTTDLIVQTGGFGLIVMDLADITPHTASRISLASWFRLRHGVEHTPAALLVLGETLHAKSCSTLQLEMSRKEARWSGQDMGKLLRGMRICAVSCKHFQAKAAEFEVHAYSRTQ